MRLALSRQNSNTKTFQKAGNPDNAALKRPCRYGPEQSMRQKANVFFSAFIYSNYVDEK
jgi:hypothetical protein